MRSPEEFILFHAEQPYDAAKAHEYYERTKKLKGRLPGAGEPASKSRSKAAVIPITKAKSAKQKPVGTKAKAAALQARLTKLRKVLAELVKQAKARSGVVDEEKSSKDGKSGGSSHATAKEKRASKDYYEKHKKDAPSSDVKDLQEKIAAVQEKISKMRAEIAAAKAKKNPDSVGAGTKTNR
jgi:outer membrane murein-binding lipoprotein Lpp